MDIKAFAAEFDHEMAVTRSLLALVPDDRADWTPHPRSMALGKLAIHIASLPSMGMSAFAGDELDMNPPGGPPFTMPVFTSTAETLAAFDRNVQAARDTVLGATAEQLAATWALKNAGQTIFAMPRTAVVRSFMLNHLIHHRGQLSVYLRLNDVPLPSIYGPTADTQG